MESPRDEDQFDWTFPLPLQPVNPTNLEGAGTVCETKRFDSFYNANGDRVELPAGERYRATGAQAYHSALSVTTYWNRQQEFETTVLEVRSRHMKAALRAVVPAYSSYNITARHISISGEPWCLFHYRQELLDYGAQLVHQGNDVEAAHVQHLISYMWTTFANEILAFYTVEFATGFDPSLEHKYLWMVFRPGDILYIRERGSCAFLLKELSLRVSWILSGYCIDYDGKSYGFRSFSAIISRYDGIRPLKELEVVQLNWLSEEERQIIKEKLVTRGQKFVGIHGQQCLSYNEYSDESTGGRVRTRIIADREGYDKWGPGYSINLASGQKTFDAKDALVQMTEDDFMLCSPYIAGYSLGDNKWGTFDIDSISDTIFDSQAFDDLVLKDDEKQQILSLVRVHQDASFSFDDLVQGKGRGMVFLLYGDPGVGKTLTAESVADCCQKPLLRLDAGSLGTSASSVEKGLRDAFCLAERWHALLLLDEADVYLEQRKSKNLVHNGIVSVFLRMLEYYQGILFLTTNRINSFDSAFISRIHLAIRYPPLVKSSRLKLLHTFLKQASQESAELLSNIGVLGELAKEKLNGRQIKNLVRTACALALSEDAVGCRIYERHLKLALKHTKQFARSIEKESLCSAQQELAKGEEDDEEQPADIQSDDGNEDEPDDNFSGDEDDDDEDDDEDDDDDDEDDGDEEDNWEAQESQQQKKRRRLV